MATRSTTSLPARSTPVLPEAALHVTGAARLVLPDQLNHDYAQTLAWFMKRRLID